MDHKEKLIQRIKDVGQEIIDRAEEIATGDLKTELSIYVKFPMDETSMDYIYWTTEVVNKNQYNRIMYGKGD